MRKFIFHCKVWNYIRKHYKYDCLGDYIHVLHGFFRPSILGYYELIYGMMAFQEFIKEDYYVDQT